MRRIALAALLLAACGPTEVPGGTPPWVGFHRAQGVVVMVDTSRVAARSGVAELWLREEGSRPGGETGPRVYMGSEVPVRLGPGGYEEIRAKVDCSLRRINELSTVARDTAGYILGQRAGRTYSRFDAHPLGPEVLPALCVFLKRSGVL